MRERTAHDPAPRGRKAWALLRGQARTSLGAGDSPAATRTAARLVQLNPYDENFQALLVRLLAAAGDGVRAARQVARAASCSGARARRRTGDRLCRLPWPLLRRPW